MLSVGDIYFNKSEKSNDSMLYITNIFLPKDQRELFISHRRLIAGEDRSQTLRLVDFNTIFKNKRLIRNEKLSEDQIESLLYELAEYFI